MKNILIFQWFDCKDNSRKEELIECVEHNLKLGFDEIIIFNDSVNPQFFGTNVKNITSTHRLTFRDYIEIINDPVNFGSLVTLTNTDIKIDIKTLELNSYIKEKMLIAISRYESQEHLAVNPWCTQDVWILLSQPIHNSILMQSSIPLGLPGCELRFSEILFAAGFEVYNPCLDIKNLHVHSKENIHLDENRIYGAYLFTPACKLIEMKSNYAATKPVLKYLPSFLTYTLNIQ